MFSCAERCLPLGGASRCVLMVCSRSRVASCFGFQVFGPRCAFLFEFLKMRCSSSGIRDVNVLCD